MQSFMGTINFVRRFVPDFAQIVKPLQQMVKKSVQFKWTDSKKNVFNKIKTSIYHSPSLKSPNFEKDFILYTFTQASPTQSFSHEFDKCRNGSFLHIPSATSLSEELSTMDKFYDLSDQPIVGF